MSGLAITNFYEYSLVGKNSHYTFYEPLNFELRRLTLLFLTFKDFQLQLLIICS